MVLNPVCLLELEEGTEVEIVETGKSYEPDRIAAKEIRRLSGDKVPPRFEASEVYDFDIGDSSALVPVSGIEKIHTFDSELRF